MGLSCCAADAYAVSVRARGAPAPPPDTWVRVEGGLGAPAGADDPPPFDITALEVVPRPAQP